MVRRGRIILVLFALGLGLTLVAGRLVYLQVVKRSDFAARAERQQQRLVRLEPRRGTIFDRRGRELAVSVDVDSVYGVPRAVDDPRELARRLAPILRQDARSLERRLAGDRQFVWLCRKIDPARAEKVKDLGAGQVRLLAESRRFYPKKGLAGPLIGFTGVDNEGLEGVERAYDAELRGTEGWLLAEKDAVGRTVFPGGPGFQFTLPTPGRDVVLTIDEVIQHIAEKELSRAMAAAKAKGGVCVVMNPATGEVLGLSVRTQAADFNPNVPQQYRPSQWRNRAVTDSFEPGSIFKPVLAAAALEEHVVHPLERFDCSAGRIQVADRVIKDAKNHGVLTFSDVIAESSNVGTIMVAQRLGKERYHRYIRSFGFGSRTGIDLPGEIAGLVKDWRLWSGVSIGAMAIGQEIGVTPIQVAAAYSALANGGTLMKPRVVSEIVDAETGERKSFAPGAGKQIVSAETCARLTPMLEKVVVSGTGTKARPDGYTAAGKTGTAQKIDERTGAYSRDEYISSFAGFVPANKPRLVIVVMIDSPRGVVWGGSVAGPVFKAVAEQSLAYLQVPPDDAGGGTMLVAR